MSWSNDISGNYSILFNAGKELGITMRQASNTINAGTVRCVKEY